jgi:3-deoxy-D-arabino-heptulosonate 7-phosphate (DAHP) synthase
VEPLDSLPSIGAPATGALKVAGYTRLRQLAGVPRADLAALHGVGPKALRILEEALDEHDLSLG